MVNGFPGLSLRSGIDRGQPFLQTEIHQVKTGAGIALHQHIIAGYRPIHNPAADGLKSVIIQFPLRPDGRPVFLKFLRKGQKTGDAQCFLGVGFLGIGQPVVENEKKGFVLHLQILFLIIPNYTTVQKAFLQFLFDAAVTGLHFFFALFGAGWHPLADLLQTFF